jgi:hypothetical protein
MQLGLEISFDDFLAKLQTDEAIYLFVIMLHITYIDILKKNINHGTYTQMYLTCK